ncbi:MAG: T9SS type A sorting domain-containing protein [Flavobacteriales bacterium]
MKKLLFSLLAIGFMASSYAQHDTLSIDSIQWVSQANLGACNDVSRYNGDTVVVVGICLVNGTDYGSQSHNLMISQSSKPSPFGGLRFRQGDPNAVYTTSVRNLLKGDSIMATGILSQYRGETQLEPLEKNGSIIILNRGVAVMDTIIEVGMINNGTQINQLSTGEQWESSLVTIKDVEVQSVGFFSSGSRVSYVVADKAGNKINIGDFFAAQKLPQYTHPVTGKPGKYVPPSVGDQFASITGVIVHDRNCTGETGRGYELNPIDSGSYVYGPAAPRIGSVKRNIAVPSSSDDVIITADIFDLDGVITKATLHWSTGTNVTSSFADINMTNTSGKIYTATIPKQANNTFVRYYVSAEDDSSNVSAQPNKDPKISTYSYRVTNSDLEISDVQFTPYADGVSIYRGQEVTVTGIVTAGGKDGDLSMIHMQEEGVIGGWSGIILANAGRTFDRNLKIQVTGTVQEDNRGRTAIGNITKIKELGIGSIKPFYSVPDSFSTRYDFTKHEKFESVLVGLINGTTTGNGKLHIVDTNPDAPNNFAEYTVGRDPFDPSTDCRVVAGRSDANTTSSTFVSYVNDSPRIADSASYPVQKILVRDTMNMDTLIGIMTISFSNMKLMPRNNADFIGINVLPTDTTKKDTTSVNELIGENSSFRVFPNPASEQITVVNSSDSRYVSIRIIDLNGKEVARTETVLEENNIPLYDLGAGVYLLQIENRNGTVLERIKFIKQ